MKVGTATKLANIIIIIKGDHTMETPSVILYFGETSGFWIQTGAFILSAIGAIYVIWHNAFTARRRATIDHIIHQRSDKDLTEATDLVFKLNNDGVQFSKFSGQLDSPERLAILDVLNNHEFIALGIRRGAFEEQIYKELQFTNFKRVHSACAGFIAEIRATQRNKKIFQEFDWLIARWDSSPLKEIKEQRMWCNPARYIDL